MAEVRAVLVLSTGHVSAVVCDWLNEQGELAAAHHREPTAYPGVSMGAHVYGWTIYAHEPGEWQEKDTPAEVSAVLDAIFAYAQTLGIYLIHFDADGPEALALPSYNWGRS